MLISCAKCNVTSSHIALRHDFHKDHGGHGGPCDKQGIMSYEPPSLPGTWSTCSRRDQEKAFRKSLHVCMAPSGDIRVANDLTFCPTQIHFFKK